MIEAERSKNYRSATRSTLPFPATRRKLLNGASTLIHVNDKHPRPFRFSSYQTKLQTRLPTQAVQFPSDPISQRRGVRVHAYARACNCSRRRGSSTFLDVFHVLVRERDSGARATSRLRRHYGESGCFLFPLERITSNLELILIYLEKWKKKREKYVIPCSPFMRIYFKVWFCWIACFYDGNSNRPVILHVLNLHIY